MEYSAQQLKKFYVSSAIKALILVVFSAGVIFVAYREINKEVDLLREERTLGAIIDIREDNINKLKDNYQAVEKDVVNAKEVVPVSGAKLFEVLRVLKSLGEFSAKQVSITFSEASKTSEFNEMLFNIYAQGTIVELTKYIKLLESLPYGIKIISYDIAGQGGVVNNSELHLQIKMMFRKK